MLLPHTDGAVHQQSEVIHYDKETIVLTNVKRCHHQNRIYLPSCGVT